MSQCRAFGHERLQFLHRVQPGLKIHAGKRLAAIKRFAVPVEIPVVILGNLLARVILPDNNPDASGTRARMPTLAAPRSGKNDSAGRCRKTLKIICIDLHAGKFDRLERLFDLLDAHAVMPQLAGLREFVEDAENFRPV